MSLTRKLLKELALEESAIERIIAAHVETVDAIRHERDDALARVGDREALLRERDEWRDSSETHLAALNGVQAEYAAYRAQVDEHLHRTARRACLVDALRRHGANEQAIPLLADALPLTEEDWQGDDLADEENVMHQAKAQYAPLFAVKKAIPTTRCAPPVEAGGALTPGDLRRMSPADINRNWESVKAALNR